MSVRILRHGSLHDPLAHSVELSSTDQKPLDHAGSLEEGATSRLAEAVQFVPKQYRGR